MTRAFTPEQRAAIADRAGSRLLAANAGSGKTAVMVERFAQAVLDDDVPVGAILALTFTDKAAGELRERVRRRFAEAGEPAHARATEGAWIGTIHGFCARVLRTHPLAAGLDPRFTVLDEPAARRLQAAAWEDAVEAWVAAEGEPALDLLAAQGPALAGLVTSAWAQLRSRGQRAPRLPVPAAFGAPDPAGLQAAALAATACLEDGTEGVTVQRGRAALDAAAALLDRLGPGEVPRPGELDVLRLATGAKRLEEAACRAYREALAAYRAACADFHAQPALALLDRLLERFDAACTAHKAARAVVDFEDLQLLARDLLRGDDGLRARWRDRFRLVMVDEFQDTNRLQLEVLELLERENLFAVGDEFQSIYGFRHADVTIFRERAQALGSAGVRRLRTNFRSREELLDVLDGAFAPLFGRGFEPLVAGAAGSADAGGVAEPVAAAAAGAPAGDEADLRLFDPDHVDVPVSAAPAAVAAELLVTATEGWEAAEPELGPASEGDQPWRRAEARLIAQRLRREVDGGRRPGEIAVLVRAAASLRLVEAALEERGLATSVIGGRGYWSHEQVRDGLAWLSVLANPLDEASLYAVLASPFCGVGVDALALTAQAGAQPEAGRPGAWAALVAAFDTPGAAPAGWAGALPEADRAALARLVPLLAEERAHAERAPAEVLLERAIAATGYDVAILARPGGERRLANLRKLMRLAREFERAEGRDLRAFLAYAATQDLTQAREGEAALESEGLDAVRLMTIHRAKGLEFPVVCVADLGRQGRAGADPLLLGADGRRVGLRLRGLGEAQPEPALDWIALRDEQALADDAEERRLLYVAFTRAQETLIVSGGVDLERPAAPRPGAAPMAWVLPALLDEPARLRETPRVRADRTWAGRPARLAVRVNAPGNGTLEPLGAPVAGRGGAGTALPAPPTLRRPVAPAAPSVPGLPRRLSYTSLGAYAKCGYRWYLQRRLGLPEVAAPAPAAGPDTDVAPGAAAGLDPRVRGTLVHVLLEALDFRRPAEPAPAAVAAAAAASGAEPTAAEVEDVARLVAAFGDSPLCARLAGARGVRRETPFAFGLGPEPDGLLVHGVVDVLATEPGGALVVDYKTDRLDGADPAELTARDYGGQRLVYALAALRGGAARVEVAHCYLERPGEPAVAVYTPADAAGLTEELVGLAEGLLAGRFEPTPHPHRELCGTCPGRKALCSHPERLTLRPATEGV